MRTVHKEEDIASIEKEPALVGTYVDRKYQIDKIEWLLEAREGFDSHARDAWHLLIPIKNGYGIDSWVSAEQYGVELSTAIIDRLGIPFADLPCVVFRAEGDEFFFLKLGKASKEQFYEEIGRIADLARECQDQCKLEGQAFRDYVNMQVGNHLRRRKLLSAARSALPAISALLGSVVDVSELV